MVIHRPDWQRSLSMRLWTEGRERSLVRVTQPRKDAGNATLIDHQRLWTYSPRINRVLKVPSSMMGQSWMGSDFSNRDIARSTDIINRYNHRIVGKTSSGDFSLWTVESVPLENAPVVWGREELLIREDGVMLSHRFYSQAGELVKMMTASDIQDVGGRPVAMRIRMESMTKPEHWTEVIQHTLVFDESLAANTFSLSNLRNPRQ